MPESVFATRYASFVLSLTFISRFAVNRPRHGLRRKPSPIPTVPRHSHVESHLVPRSGGQWNDSRRRAGRFGDNRMSTSKVRRVDCGYCGLAIRSGRKVGAVSASLFVGPGSGPSLYRCQSRGRTRSEFHFPGECPSGVSGVETARVLGHPFAAAMPASLGGIKLRRGCPAGPKCSMKAWRRPERGTWASRVVGEERHDEG